MKPDATLDLAGSAGGCSLSVLVAASERSDHQRRQSAQNVGVIRIAAGDGRAAADKGRFTRTSVKQSWTESIRNYYARLALSRQSRPNLRTRNLVETSRLSDRAIAHTSKA